jgi:tRNA-specific 2-thiouridylase
MGHKVSGHKVSGQKVSGQKVSGQKVSGQKVSGQKVSPSTSAERIAVAMSGGVDSSVAAALLQAEGHEVVGVTLRLHAGCDGGQRERGRACCTADDVRDAAAVAGRLGFAFHTFDLRDEFRQRVVEPFAAEYARGRTPNPCVLCNQVFKFDRLLARARALGATAVATGHYVRAGRDRAGRPALFRAQHRAKDQSYFLFGTPSAALPSLRFPLGDRTKEEVRALAVALGLERVARKPESQEVCFVPDGDVGGFVARIRPDAVRGPGPIRDAAGRLLGTHRGLHHYTVGQRRGLRVAGPRPLYVCALDVADNALVVGERADCDAAVVRAAGACWLAGAPPAAGTPVVAQVRHRHAGAPGRFEPEGPDGGFRVVFAAPVHAAAPGQALVVYDETGEQLLGGGWIEP